MRGRRRNPARDQHESRRQLALLALLGLTLIELARAFQVGVLQHTRWLRRAEGQQGDTVAVPAPRGTIYDRDGVPLASSREVYIVALAPREVTDTPLVQRRMRQELGLDAQEIHGYFARPRNWAPLPGRYEETTRAKLQGIRGFYTEPVMRRFYPHGDLAAELLGNVNLYGEVAGGVEQELDSMLAGRNGKAVKRIDSRGRAIPGAMLRVTEPVPGQDVYLTVNAELQEIATDALVNALKDTGADGGEMLIIDPRTGEILAAASRSTNSTVRTWTGATAPYEPGSTIKPFTVASLLAQGRAALSDSIYAEEGSYRLNGRTITDTHPNGWLTLRQAFLESSNIVMAKVSSRMEPAEQYRLLRDFGFGVPTGIEYPSESGGRLRKPNDWSKQSQASLAFGYEISVTPLQLAMAYAALANGGVLMEPLLVREIRARDGRIFRSAEPHALRRVVPSSVAAQMRELMAEVVEKGTGKSASLGSWRVAGKTGTARYSAGGHYVSGAYIATFAGFFPADDPQIVFLVKLDRPRGDYYASQTAAPVTRATLQAALAARGTPLDRAAIMLAGPEVSAATTARGPRLVSAARTEVSAAAAAEEPVVLHPDEAPAKQQAGEVAPAKVPDVAGASLRNAVRALHVAGFRVRVEGSGRVRGTVPNAGAAVRAGGTVVVVAGGAQ